MSKTTKTTTTVAATTETLQSIDATQLDNVSGGGLIGGAIKLGAKAAPFIKKAGPKLVKAAKHAAIATGIPAGFGSVVAGVQHHFDHNK